MQGCVYTTAEPNAGLTLKLRFIAKICFHPKICCSSKINFAKNRLKSFFSPQKQHN